VGKRKRQVCENHKSHGIIYGGSEFDVKANYRDAKEEKRDILIKPKDVEARGALRRSYMDRIAERVNEPNMSLSDLHKNQKLSFIVKIRLPYILNFILPMK